jgi:hypothetical protein
MVQVQDWPELTRAINENLRELRAGAPEVMKAFGALTTTAHAEKALNAKTMYASHALAAFSQLSATAKPEG